MDDIDHTNTIGYMIEEWITQMNFDTTDEIKLLK
jgi:hypothetical protein